MSDHYRPHLISRTLVPALCLALIGLSSCHLHVDLEDHPYPLPFEPPDEPDADPSVEDVPELPDDADTPSRGPALLISEVMIRPSTPPVSPLELGEYIEIFNAGDVPIDPLDLIIEVVETNDRIYVDRLVSSPEEEEIVTNLKPIPPGGFFLFLREDHPYYDITDHLDEGTYYEYGRWHRSIPLSNFSRTLRLIEVQGELRFRIHHEIGWRQGFLVDLEGISSTRLDIRENIAFGLRSGVDEREDAERPDSWCYHLEGFSSGPLLGSPGRTSPASCL